MVLLTRKCQGIPQCLSLTNFRCYAMGQGDKLDKMEQEVEFYDEEPEVNENQEAIPIMLPIHVMRRIEVYIYFNRKVGRC